MKLKKCSLCKKIFIPTGMNQIFCGSLNKKTGCSYVNDRKKDKKWRKNNLDKINEGEYLRKRTRINWQNWRKNNSEKNRIRIAIYKLNNKDKIRAGHKLQHAIKIGKVKRMPCIICNKKAEGHHYDYTKPLDVIWLCSLHHSQIHHKIIRL